MLKSILVIISYLLLKSQISAQTEFEYRGEYLGQQKPELKPELFVPNFISTEKSEISISWHPNGSELYLTRVDESYFFRIMISKLENGIWTEPKQIWEGDGMIPVISKDGQKLFFGSIDLIDEVDSIREPNLWVMERNGDVWGKAKPLSSNVNTPDEGEWFPSIADDGTLYFKGGKFREGIECIYYSEIENGRYQKPKLLFESNFFTEDPFVAPDESFVIFNPHNPPEGAAGMYISFKDNKGKWSTPKYTGLKGNLPSLSPDRKYMFFIQNEDVFWVDAKIIDTFK